MRFWPQTNKRLLISEKWVVWICKMIIDNTFSLSLDSTWWSMCQPSTVLTSILDGLSSLVYASASLLWCGFLDTPFTTSSQLLGLSRRWAFCWLKPKHLETGLSEDWAIVYYSITLLNLSHFPYRMSDSLPDVRFLLLFLVLKIIKLLKAIRFCQYD